jgi:Mg2+-importing ATPase
MAPIQVLVNNLLYDFSQVGIPTDRVDDEYMGKPRRWNIASIKKFMLYLGPVSSVFDYTTFFLMLLFYHCWNYSLIPSDEEIFGAQVTQLGIAWAPFAIPVGTIGFALKSYYEALFHTAWFVESILTQTLIVHVIRTNRIPFLQSRASFALSVTTVAVMGAAAAMPYLPKVGPYLGLVPLPMNFWGFMVVTLLAYVVLAHLMKTWFIKRYGAD